MTAIASDLSNIKLSLRIDHSYDDEILLALIDTAKQYIVSAIDSDDTQGIIPSYKQFDWAVSLLVQHWYEYRLETPKEHIPTTVQALIQQMRGAYYASEQLTT